MIGGEGIVSHGILSNWVVVTVWKDTSTRTVQEWRGFVLLLTVGIGKVGSNCERRHNKRVR